MQKVFEKIIEKLEECKDIMISPKVSDCFEEECKYNDCTVCVFAKAIEIVKQETEKYNNGWIPCSERLPEEHKLYDITFKNSAGIHSDSAIYNPYLKRWLWDADETELVENEILAWAEKREPYQPKEEFVK